VLPLKGLDAFTHLVAVISPSDSVTTSPDSITVAFRGATKGKPPPLFRHLLVRAFAAAAKANTCNLYISAAFRALCPWLSDDTIVPELVAFLHEIRAFPSHLSIIISPSPSKVRNPPLQRLLPLSYSLRCCPPEVKCAACDEHDRLFHLHEVRNDIPLAKLLIFGAALRDSRLWFPHQSKADVFRQWEESDSSGISIPEDVRIEPGGWTMYVLLNPPGRYRQSPSASPTAAVRKTSHGLAGLCVHGRRRKGSSPPSLRGQGLASLSAFPSFQRLAFSRRQVVYASSLALQVHRSLD
jgi:hypothetical protein